MANNPIRNNFGITVNPGRLNTKIRVQAPSSAARAKGDITRERSPWKDIGARYNGEIHYISCEWIEAHGFEIYEASQKIGTVPATVHIRWRPDINSSCRIIKDEKEYEIIGEPENVRGRNQWIEMKVKRKVSA